MPNIAEKIIQVFFFIGSVAAWLGTCVHLAKINEAMRIASEELQSNWTRFLFWTLIWLVFMAASAILYCFRR